MKDKFNIIKVIFCFIVICFFSLFGMASIVNNNSYSKVEQRALKTYPEITISSLMSDEFYNEYTEAFSDQLILRNKFVRLYYLLNQQRYVDDMVRGSEEQLYYAPVQLTNDELFKNELTEFIRTDLNNVALDVSNLGAKFIYVSIPRKDALMTYYLPSSYLSNQDKYVEYSNIVKEEISDDVTYVDVYDMFKNKVGSDKDIFYNTDHHVNIYGGYAIFEHLVDIVNQDKHNIKINKLSEEYFIKKVNMDGSFSRRFGTLKSDILEDLILIPKNYKIEYTRYESGEISNLRVFGEGNTYAEAYMGGDFAETYVKTNIKNAPSILYVGTSYTNILEALSVYKFSEVLSVDYRHNKTLKTIVDYVEEYDIDYVVYIHAQSDNSFNLKSMKQQLGF